MKPSRDDSHAVVDLVDVLLREGAVVDADIVVSVGGVPLVGISLRAAIAGMATMTEHGLLTEWDQKQRDRAAETSERASRSGGKPTTAHPDESVSSSEQDRRDRSSDLLKTNRKGE
jgi:hypothetical protein